MLLEYVKKYMHYKNIWCKRIFEDNIGFRAICTITDKEVIGVSTPFGGVSWERRILEKDRFKYLFTYLKSKRILINPIEMEVLEQCIQSVLQIKDTLIEITRDVEFSSVGLHEIENMITAIERRLKIKSNIEIPSKW